MNPKLILIALCFLPAAAAAQSSPKFALSAVSLGPSVAESVSTKFQLEGSLGSVFSQVTTSRALEVVAGILPFRLPESFVGPFIDTDNDGLADGWEVFYFGNTAAGGDDDSDGDGEDNSAEQAAATDPQLAASVFRMRPVTRSGAKVSFWWTGAAEKEFEVGYSPDLGATAWTPIGVVTSSSKGFAAFDDDDPARTTLPAGFYRVTLRR